MKWFVFEKIFDWKLFLKKWSMINQHCFKEWIGAGRAPSHSLKQCWLRPMLPAGNSPAQASATYAQMLSIGVETCLCFLLKTSYYPMDIHYVMFWLYFSVYWSLHCLQTFSWRLFFCTWILSLARIGYRLYGPSFCSERLLLINFPQMSELNTLWQIVFGVWCHWWPFIICVVI